MLSRRRLAAGRGRAAGRPELQAHRPDVGHRGHHPVRAGPHHPGPSISGALVVQGGPGTGKTAVALHRAAYLLYTHRDRLKSAGVLLVGPTSSFMKLHRARPAVAGGNRRGTASLGRLMPGHHRRAGAKPDVAAHQGPAATWPTSSRPPWPTGSAFRQENRILGVDGRKLTAPRPGRSAAPVNAPAPPGKPHNEARVIVRQDPAPRADRADDRARRGRSTSATTPTAPTSPRTSRTSRDVRYRAEPVLDADDP